MWLHGQRRSLGSCIIEKQLFRTWTVDRVAVAAQAVGDWAECSWFKPPCGQNLESVLVAGGGTRMPSEYC